jgi:hypothetical protein
MSELRRTTLIHGRRVYADSIRVKELSPGGAVIVYGDGVSSYDNDWDKSAAPITLVFNEAGADGGRRG